MHITIQKALQFSFIALIALPLPILIVYYPVMHIREKQQKKKHYKIVKKHYEDPATVSAEQLNDIFPDKKLNELHDIAYNLQENNSYNYN